MSMPISQQQQHHHHHQQQQKTLRTAMDAGGGRGRGADRTLPAWMTAATKDPSAAASNAAAAAGLLGESPAAIAAGSPGGVKRGAPDSAAELPPEKSAKPATDAATAAAVAAAASATLTPTSAMMESAKAANTLQPPPAAAAAPPVSTQTAEEKELADKLEESIAVEYEHGPPGDQVKVTESRTFLAATYRVCNARQNDMKARGRKTLSLQASAEKFLGSSGEIIGYDRSSLTVKVRMGRDGTDLSLPVECVGVSGEARWLDKVPADDKPDPAPMAAPPGVTMGQQQRPGMMPGMMQGGYPGMVRILSYLNTLLLVASLISTPFPPSPLVGWRQSLLHDRIHTKRFTLTGAAVRGCRHR